MFYVYIIESERISKWDYGSTERNPAEQPLEHNGNHHHALRFKKKLTSASSVNIQKYALYRSWTLKFAAPIRVGGVNYHVMKIRMIENNLI